MDVISHRGMWRDRTDANSREALARSFTAGIGTETDLRDALGTIVVSHDPPSRGVDLCTLDELLDIFVAEEGLAHQLPLALNIKADGLADQINAALDTRGITSAFVFDMSAPDQRSYHLGAVPVYTRHSDVEPAPSNYEDADGVWLDSFGDDVWVDAEVVASHRCRGKRVCVVSSELHGRDPSKLWERLAASDWLRADPGVLLCTDRPVEAQSVLSGGIA